MGLILFFLEGPGWNSLWKIRYTSIRKYVHEVGTRSFFFSLVFFHIALVSIQKLFSLGKNFTFQQDCKMINFLHMWKVVFSLRIEPYGKICRRTMNLQCFHVNWSYHGIIEIKISSWRTESFLNNWTGLMQWCTLGLTPFKIKDKSFEIIAFYNFKLTFKMQKVNTRIFSKNAWFQKDCSHILKHCFILSSMCIAFPLCGSKLRTIFAYEILFINCHLRI